ncbi:hypothetical protein XELAEV_18014074mg [Xenopus laevis]|nr:hypothetical protein XELAEV_18014074mg [Xenopus laevis]
MLTGFCLFLSLVSVILFVFFSIVQVRESARYVLFAHMLINDTLYLSLGLYLMVTSLYFAFIPVPVCYVIVTLVSCTFKITPYNLAVMSLERYVAICHPLRYVEICSGHRSGVTIAGLWALAMAPNVADFISLSLSADRTFYSLHVICTKEILILNITQQHIRSNTLIVSVSLVAIIILYTYVKVMLVAQKFGSGNSSAIKAGKTVLLHAFQLFLSMIALLTPFIVTSNKEYISILPISNFLFFTCLPRFIGPLIYGLRDELLFQCLRKLYSSGP